MLFWVAPVALRAVGTAFVSKSWKYTEYGATGFGVQTLIELAREMSAGE